ncbi:MAG: glycosyltransferase, partial [candidate division Zixibacteria bacterium]|nr:glycosyltransferase [candidate division Zixibacteria bacterium]
LPVVATAVGGNRELVVDGETGFLITAGDTDTLAEKLIYLLNHGRQAQEMGRRGYERVVDRFSLPAMMEAYQAYYLGLLNV